MALLYLGYCAGEPEGSDEQDRQSPSRQASIDV